MFDAVLVANRGEIAVRIIRACRELGVRAVAVYSEADRDAVHVRLADEAFLIGPAEARRSYLDIDRIVAVAREAGVDAIHPGYGFLAENATFAEAVAHAGMVFIGPSAHAIRAMGDKLSARAVARAASVPVVAGTDGPVTDTRAAEAFATKHGLPIAIKAMFGGGGRGMKIVESDRDLAAALDAARRESRASFGRDEVYLERYLPRSRHVEVQVVGDLDGTVIHLGDRDCTLQRRHQKLIEEAPAPGLHDDLRSALADAAIRIAKTMGYTSAGTCEFLVDGLDGTPRFHFLEMNTRLQVEHPVTELVTGFDLVHAQLRIASGQGLGITQADVEVRGHAIEARINAEDPAEGFLPRPGRIERFVAPAGPGIRVDAGVESGGTISGDYDSMIAKLVVWDLGRDRARARMRRALDELHIDGPPTTAEFHRMAIDHQQFVDARHATTSVEQDWDLSALSQAPCGTTVAGGAPEQDAGREVVVEVDGRRFALRVFDQAEQGPQPRRRVRDKASGPALDPGTGALRAPMQGTVVAHLVAEGDTVAVGDVVVVVEAMKMENPISAHRDGTVTRLHVPPGGGVAKGEPLVTIE